MTHAAFSLQTEDPAELLRVLTVDMMLHHLQISNKLSPSHLWSWIDRSQIYSIDYLDKSYENILNTWTRYKSTGYGAIELGCLVNVPEYLYNTNLGLESRRLSQNEVLLKMNVNEYLALVAIVTDKVMQQSQSHKFYMAQPPHETEADFVRLDDNYSTTKPTYDPFAACMASVGLSPPALQLNAFHTQSQSRQIKTVKTPKRSGTGWLNVKKPVLRFW
jgi:hypothetical protein